ncbi:MAG: hypothetical protein HXS47_11255 [Theionarchaea archaeon]|nr:hypothetical protein [Theionarchaea archaeon]
MDKVDYPALCLQPESMAGTLLVRVLAGGMMTRRIMKMGLYPLTYFIYNLIYKRNGGMIHNGRSRYPC